MPGLRSLARRVRGGWRALRFRLWVTRLRFELARRGARLALDAPHGAELERLPIVRVHPAGAGAGTLTLRIGHGVRFGRNVALELWAHGTNRLELGDYAHVYDGARLGLYSGSISLGHHSSIRYNAILKSAGELRVGNEVFVSHGSVVHCDARVALGDRSGLAEGVTIVDSDHPLDGTDEHFYHRPLLVDPVVLEENVFVASRAVITRGVHVGRNAAVGAGAVVRRGDYPSGWLVAGVPATAVKPLVSESPPPAR